MTNRRLLVLDDEADLAKFVSRVATTLGYEVEITTHGHDFQAAVLRMEPSVIMLDIVMPDIDGIELIQWLGERQSPARIIMMTGFDPLYATIAERLGSAGKLSSITTLLKPFSIADLTAVLGNGEKFDRESAGDDGCSDHG
jgi:DNA-binding response OmpR family regulator